MDIDKLITTAKNSYQTNKYRSYRECYNDGVLVLADMIRQQLLQQTACYTASELLATMLNEEHKAYQDNIDNYMVSSEHDYNIDTLNNVIKMIKERQANDV